MAVDAGSSNWLALIGSSALISALVSAGINSLSSWLARRADRQRDEAALANRRKHLRFEIALQLEVFARRADIYLYTIQNAMRVYSGQDDSAFNHLDDTSLDLEISPSLKWEELPVGFVAEVRGLVEALRARGRSIRVSSGDSVETFYELDADRAAFYGLAACQIARRQRDDAGVEADPSFVDVMKHFTEVIEVRRAFFTQHRVSAWVLPELAAQFSREMKALPAHASGDREQSAPDAATP